MIVVCVVGADVCGVTDTTTQERSEQGIRMGKGIKASLILPPEAIFPN